MSPANLIATARALFDAAAQETDPEQGQTHLKCRNTGLMAPFPTEIREFARIFVESQGHRNQADYNPAADFYPFHVSKIIDNAEIAINQLAAAPAPIRRAFAITVLLRNRAD